MPERIRAAGILAIVLALIAYAYSPLLAAGFLGEDLAVITALDAVRGLADWYGVQGTEARPGAVLLLLASRAVWTADGLWSGSEALVVRLEHLVLLALAAWGMVGALRRALEPWAGPDVARASGYAGAALVLVHPLAVSAVARLAVRGDLAAIALGAWSVRAFLAGRQEGIKGPVVVAWVLAALAGLCSPLALYLPLLLAAVEHQSARRLRPRRVRLRTTATTLLVFTAAALAEALPRAFLAPEGQRAMVHAPPAAPPELWLERLGVLLMPGNVHGLGAGAPLLAALASLLALHPALVAARTAPRLWGRLLVGWAVALAIAIAPNAHVRVLPEGLAGAQALLTAAVVMGIGLGTASSALSGWRRTFVPIAVGGLFSILGRAQAVPHVQAAETVAVLREDLLDAARERSWNGTLLVLGLPSSVAGLDPVGGDPSVVLSPALAPRDRARGVRVVGMTRRAFEVASRGTGLDDLRGSGTSVVLPAAWLEPEAPGRRSVQLLSVGEELDRATWVGEGKSRPGMVFDPLRARHLRVTALHDAETAEAPVLRWLSDLPDDGVEVPGVWLRGDDAPEAVFDLERHGTWLLGGRVRSAWTAGGVVQITAAQVSPGPPALEGLTPRAVGEGWTFDLAGLDLPSAVGGELRWRLGLLDAASWAYEELEPLDESLSLLSFPGAARWDGQDAWWSLDLRVDDVTVLRASGRRDPSATGDTR